MSYNSEIKKVTRIFEKKFSDLDKACTRQINFLYTKHDNAKTYGVRNGIMGKIIGIEWVQNKLKELERRDEKVDE